MYQLSNSTMAPTLFTCRYTLELSGKSTGPEQYSTPLGTFLYLVSVSPASHEILSTPPQSLTVTVNLLVLSGKSNENSVFAVTTV